MKLWLSVLLALVPASGWAQPCPPAGWDRARLETLKRSDFEISDRIERARFAEAVVACLASPDPFLRDGIVYEGLTHMLRASELDDAVKIRLARNLLTRLGQADPQGFQQPFAALLLAEIVRADRIARYLPGDLRDAIVEAGTSYVAGIRDYRGFDEREGWRHGVAHGADLLMQIVLDPNVTEPGQLARVRDAVASQLMPADHFYIYGEPERLMTPIVYLARRGLYSEAEWRDWLVRIAAPPVAAGRPAVTSQASLARRHNLRTFLYAVWLNARISADTGDDVLLAGAEAALRAMS